MYDMTAGSNPHFLSVLGMVRGIELCPELKQALYGYTFLMVQRPKVFYSHWGSEDVERSVREDYFHVRYLPAHKSVHAGRYTQRPYVEGERWPIYTVDEFYEMALALFDHIEMSWQDTKNHLENMSSIGLCMLQTMIDMIESDRDPVTMRTRAQEIFPEELTQKCEPDTVSCQRAIDFAWESLLFIYFGTSVPTHELSAMIYDVAKVRFKTEI